MNHEGFTCGSVGKEPTCNVGDLGLIPGLGRSLGEGKGCPFQCCGLENSMDCIVHGVAKSQTRLGDFHLYIYIWKESCSNLNHVIFSPTFAVSMKFNNSPSKLVGHELVYFSCILTKFTHLRKYCESCNLFNFSF